MYLDKRRRKWYALHDIPADVQAAIGRGRRFCAPLDTEDHSVAKRRAVPLEAQWRGAIAKARRGGVHDPLEADAAFWRKALSDARRAGDDAAVDIILSQLSDEANARLEAAAGHGAVDVRDLPNAPEVTRFYSLAVGKLVPFADHLEAWLLTVGNVAKTIDEKRSWVTRFASKHAYVQDVTRKAVQAWVNSLALEEGYSRDTINKGLSSVRGYWKYLVSLEVAPEDALPFDRITIPKNGGGKRKPEEVRQEFEPEDVVRLLTEAKARGKDQLADLIQLAMWTGARIEELCALKLADVHADWFLVRDAKTDAGIRKVPIHSKLKPVIARLRKASAAAGDPYLLAGLPSDNKYADRSPAIGKAFGRLKTALGFGPGHVFHSIRATVATLFKAGDVPEVIAADIMGHEIQTMTYGLYAGGAPMKVLLKAIEKLAYPSPGKAKTPAPRSRSGGRRQAA